ncbi:MAG: DUF4440 domain-containing protein, partial [Albidovulum sp.]|uniref:YybH family protein n=1 Tax=Albidovulum sp. TaxID=1872424 RepID=UPI003CBEF8D8
SIAIAAAAFLALPAQAQDEQPDVTATVLGLTNAIMKGDAAKAVGFYTPDAAVMFEPSTATRGTDDIQAAYQGFLSIHPDIAYTGDHQVIVVGDIALHIAPWEMTATLQDGAAIRDGGLSVSVLRKAGDGSWRILIDDPYGAGRQQD